MPSPRLRDRAVEHARDVPFPRLPSPEITLLAFVLGTILAISPVGAHLDRVFEVKLVTPGDGDLFVLLHQTVDRLSSQRVSGLTLLLVATWFAWRRRELAPLVIAGLAEIGFGLTGVVKILLGKSATALGSPDWWHGGLLAEGKFSMAYPSGHATQAILMWGTTLLLLVLYAPGWRTRHTHVAVTIWHAIVVATLVTSWAMHRHWVSDLVAGVVFGLLCLKLVVGLVERGVPQAAAEMVEETFTGRGRPPGRPSGPDASRPPGEPRPHQA